MEQKEIEKPKDEYIALYRKWRPNGFEGLIGQDHIKKALTNALKSKRIAHAYLFTGPRGTGKTSTARILAKALNCEQGPTATPCNECGNCLAADRGSSMDIFEIDAASNRGIDEIRQLRERVAFTPVNSLYSVYIIDEVHMISVDAFNALLKTLEEPPAHVVFILATTEPQKIPATIHSRCQRFDFRRVTVDDISKHLKHVAKESKIEIEDDAVKIIALQAEGGMRDALSLLDQCSIMNGTVTSEVVRNVLGIVGREELQKLVMAIGKKDLVLSLQKLNELTLKGKDLNQIIVEVAEYLRAVLLYKVTPDYEEIYLTDTKEAIAEVAPLYTKDRLIAAEQRLHVAGQELKQTVNGRINVELCFFDLCRVQGFSIEALTARIEELEEKLARGVVVNNVSAPSAYSKRVTSSQSVSKSNPKTADYATSIEDHTEPVEDYFDPIEEVFDNSELENSRLIKSSKTVVSKVETVPNKVKTPMISNTTTESTNVKPLKTSADSDDFDVDNHVLMFEKLNISEDEVAEVAGASTTPGSAEIATGDLVMAKKIWKATIAEIKSMRKMAIAACGATGEPYAYDGSTMVISFKSKTFSTRMDKKDYKNIVQEAVQKATGKNLNMQFILKSKGIANSKATDSLKANAGSIPKNGVDKMEKLKAMKMEDCNCTQKALKVFGGVLKKS